MLYVHSFITQADVDGSLSSEISDAERVKEEEIFEAEKKCNLAISQAREKFQSQLTNEDRLLEIANVRGAAVKLYTYFSLIYTFISQSTDLE